MQQEIWYFDIFMLKLWNQAAKLSWMFLLSLSKSTESSNIVENNNNEKMSVKASVEELETIESERQDNRLKEKQNLVKPLKKRPKSEGFEMFENKGIVIGVVSG